MRKSTADRRKTSFPEQFESFWIEVAWVVSDDDEMNDPEWKTTNNNVSGVNVVWWPGFAEIESYERNLFSLSYSRSQNSTSINDLDRSEIHEVTFLMDKCINHVSGSEKGKICKWRYPRWEEAQNQDESFNVETARITDIDELRGCFLELQRKLIENDGIVSIVQDRLDAVEERLEMQKRKTPASRLQSYLINAIGTGVTYEGKDSRSLSEVSAGSLCVRQSVAKVRSVDCTLSEFRELARETESSKPSGVSFSPSTFKVCRFNMRQKHILSLQFDTFAGMCEAIKLSRNWSSQLTCQWKVGLDDNISSYQFVGQLFEASVSGDKNETGTTIPECVFLVGGSFDMLRRNIGESGFVISRTECQWHEQSSTCDGSFTCSIRNADELVKLMSQDCDQRRELEEKVYRLEWEPLDATVGEHQCGETAVLGKLHTIIPIIQVRTKRVLREMEEIFRRQAHVLRDGGGWFSR